MAGSAIINYRQKYYLIVINWFENNYNFLGVVTGMIEVTYKSEIDLKDPSAIAKEIEALKRDKDKQKRLIIEQYSKKYQIKYENCNRVNDSFIVFSKGKKIVMTQEQINKFLDIEARLHKVIEDCLIKERELFRSAFAKIIRDSNKQSTPQSDIPNTYKKQVSDLKNMLSAQVARTQQLQNKWKKERNELSKKIKQLEDELKLTKQKIENMIQETLAKMKNTFLQEEIQDIKAKNQQPNLYQQITEVLNYLLDQEEIIFQREQQILKLKRQLMSLKSVKK